MKIKDTPYHVENENTRVQKPSLYVYSVQCILHAETVPSCWYTTSHHCKYLQMRVMPCCVQARYRQAGQNTPSTTTDKDIGLQMT